MQTTKMHCSPKAKFMMKSHKSCFSKKQLLSMTKLLNITVASPRNNKDTLWNAINQHMLNVCDSNDESCWIEKMNIDVSSSHVPIAPSKWKSNPYEWLTSVDILNVMIQYEHRYRSFKFVGVFPIDFATKTHSGSCISSELCNVQFNRIKNKNQFGIVFNLDKHDEPGSHWICVYINMKKSTPNYGFFFFDSTGNPMPPEVKRLSESVKSQANDENFTVYENDVQKQFKNTECGMFCLYFLIEALKKKKLLAVYNNKIRDEDVHSLRNVLFMN